MESEKPIVNQNKKTKNDFDLDRTESSGVLGGVTTSAVAALVVYLYLGNLALSGAVFVGFSWVTLALRVGPVPENRFTPLRVFVPAFGLYSLTSIACSTSDTKLFELGANTITLFTFVLGYLFVISTRKKHLNLAGPTLGPVLNLTMIRGYWLASFIVYCYLAFQSKGLPLFSSDVNFYRTVFFPNGVTSTIVVVGFQCAAIVLPSVRLMDGAIKIKKIDLLITALSVFALVSLGNRGMLAAPVITLVIIFARKRNFKPWITVIAALTGAFLLSYLGYLRNLGSFGESYLGDLYAQGYSANARFVAPILSYLGGTSETFSRTIHLFPQVIPFQMGQQFFGPLLHNQSADLFLKEKFGLTYTGFGLALGYTNAFYLDWGIWGCVLGSLLFGVFVGSIYSSANFQEPRWVALTSFTLAQLLLATYGHPFAYISYLLIPLLLFLSFRNGVRKF